MATIAPVPITRRRSIVGEVFFWLALAIAFDRERARLIDRIAKVAAGAVADKRVAGQRLGRLFL